jgi:hypothetical protein
MRRAMALAPTHAHPLAVGPPAAPWTVGPFVALLDRARDRIVESGDARALPVGQSGRGGAW